MRIKELALENFRGYEKANFKFGDFQIFVGPNGHGKTTVLDAVSLMCSSLDFGNLQAPAVDLNGDDDDVSPMVAVANERLKAYLRKNIRHGQKGFRVSALFEHEGQDLTVELTETGFVRNDLLKHPLWWAGMSYFTKFDSEMTSFQLPLAVWEKFKPAYESVTGFTLEPEILEETDLAAFGEDGDIVVGFWAEKPASYGRPASRIYHRECSAGEKKIAKALTQIINLEEHRQPHIVLVDNIEMHLYYKRHLNAIAQIKNLFAGKQIIATTHSQVVMQSYEPKSEIIDLETLLEEQYLGRQASEAGN